jgi:hypothetical protein
MASFWEKFKYIFFIFLTESLGNFFKDGISVFVKAIKYSISTKTLYLIKACSEKKSINFLVFS